MSSILFLTVNLKKKVTTYKSRVMFYLVGIQETVFQVTRREALRGTGGRGQVV